MTQDSSIYVHMGAQAAGLAFYLMLARKAQGVCSAAGAVSGTALQYIHSNQIDSKKNHTINKASMVLITLGCLFSETGVKTWGLSLVYFGVAYDAIHTHRPKHVDILPLPPERGEIRPPQDPIEKKKDQPIATDTEMFLAFYRGENKGNCTFTLDTILSFDEGKLEQHHNFIQWLFPIWTYSGNCPKAHRLHNDTILAFAGNKPLRDQQKKAFILMLDHYGLKLVESDEGEYQVVKNPQTFNAKKKYLQAGNHNLLRITRMLTSLTHLGQPELAKAFYKCLDGLTQTDLIGTRPSLIKWWQPVSLKTPECH